MDQQELLRVVEVARAGGDELVDQQILGARDAQGHAGEVVLLTVADGVLLEWQQREADVDRDPGRFVSEQEDLTLAREGRGAFDSRHDAVTLERREHRLRCGIGYPHGGVDVERRPRDAACDDGHTTDHQPEGAEFVEGGPEFVGQHRQMPMADRSPAEALPESRPGRPHRFVLGLSQALGPGPRRSGGAGGVDQRQRESGGPRRIGAPGEQHSPISLGDRLEPLPPAADLSRVHHVEDSANGRRRRSVQARRLDFAARITRLFAKRSASRTRRRPASAAQSAR